MQHNYLFWLKVTERYAHIKMTDFVILVMVLRWSDGSYLEG